MSCQFLGRNRLHGRRGLLVWSLADSGPVKAQRPPDSMLRWPTRAALVCRCDLGTNVRIGVGPPEQPAAHPVSTQYSAQEHPHRGARRCDADAVRCCVRVAGAQRRWGGDASAGSSAGGGSRRVWWCVRAATPHVPVSLEADASTMRGTVHRAGLPARQRACHGARAQRGRAPPDHDGGTCTRVYLRQVTSDGGSRRGKGFSAATHAPTHTPFTLCLAGLSLARPALCRRPPVGDDTG